MADPGGATTPNPDQSPIFIIGAGRCGTNLMRMMLNAHPRIHIAHEVGLYHVTNQARGGTFRRRGMRPLTARQWLDFYLRHDMFQPWSGVPPEVIRRSVPATLADDDLREAYRHVLRCRAEPWGRPRYGTQSPLNARFIPEIFQDFPAAKIIHVVRDPRDMVVSNLRRPESATSLILIGRFLKHRLDDIVTDARVLEVRLENLLADREGGIRRALEYVGEPWDDRVLEHWQHAPLDLPPFPWFRGKARSPDHPRSRWQDTLSPAWVRNLEAMLGPPLDRFGYSRAQLDREPTRRERWAAWLRDAPALIHDLSRIPRATRKMQSTPPPPGPEGYRLLCSFNARAQQMYGEFTWPEPTSPQS
jgi:hypothetical protein